MRRSGRSLKETVNLYLRLGLINGNQPEKDTRFEVTPFPLGLRPGLSYDSISTLLEEAEGPRHR
jgi:hypothetical protein